MLPRKTSSVLIHLPRELALGLMDFHSGQFTAIYAAASTAVAGKKVPANVLQAAIDELDRDFGNGRKKVNREARALYKSVNRLLVGVLVEERYFGEEEV